MIEGVTGSEQTQATSPIQANLLALRNEARAQEEVANMLQQQARQTREQVPPPSNPDGVGQNVDTYA